MSRTYFHSPSADIEIPGPERHWHRSLTDNLGMSVLTGNAIRGINEWTQMPLPPGVNVRTDDALEHWTKLWLGYGSGEDQSSWIPIPGAGHVDPWTITLNTCMVLGSDPVRFAARHHAQCEIHAWIDGGQDRHALADVITEGLASGVNRRLPGRPGGWGDLVSMLRGGPPEIVVMSHSSGAQFPDPWAIGWVDGIDPDREDDQLKDWDRLGTEGQWEHATRWLRDQPGWLQIVPDQLASYRFGVGLTWLDLIDGPDRVAEVLAAGEEEVLT